MPIGEVDVHILQYVKSLNIPFGQTHRGECPHCGRKDTFTATNEGVHYVWNCYSAHCPVKGKAHKEMSAKELSASLEVTKKSIKPFEIPERFIPVSQSPTATSYMRHNNIMDAYIDGKVRLYYDPAQIRLVFIVPDQDGKPYAAVGRAISPAVQPKWYVYGDDSNLLYPFVCKCETPDTGAVFLVEDAASACAVYKIGHGVAMLGSTLSDNYIPTILGLKPKLLILALDKDASTKALDMQRKMSYYVESKIMLLDLDLKNYTAPFIAEKVRKLLDG